MCMPLNVRMGKRHCVPGLFPWPLSCGPQGLLCALDHTEEAE